MDEGSHKTPRSHYCTYFVIFSKVSMSQVHRVLGREGVRLESFTSVQEHEVCVFRALLDLLPTKNWPEVSVTYPKGPTVLGL